MKIINKSKSVIVILMLTFSIALIGFSIIGNFPRWNSILTLIILIVSLYLSQLVLNLVHSIIRIVLIFLSKESINSISMFPFIIFRRRNGRVKIAMNHFYTLKNRTYGTRSRMYSKRILRILSSSLYIVFAGVAIFSLLYSKFNVTYIASIIMYLCIYSINFELTEESLFERYYFSLYLKEFDERIDMEISNLSKLLIDERVFGSEDIKFLIFYSISMFYKGIELSEDLIINVNTYILTSEDIILDIMYLEFIYIQMFCYSKIASSLKIVEIKELFINTVKIKEWEFGTDYGFILTGRLLKNYERVLNSNHGDLETRHLFSFAF